MLRDKDKIKTLLRKVRKYTLKESNISKNLGQATIDYALSLQSLKKRDENFLRYVASKELPKARIHKVSVVNTQRQEGPNTRNQNKVSYMQYLVVVYSDTNGAFHNKKKIELGTKEISGMLKDFYGDRVDEVDEDEEEEDEEEEDENVLPLPINAFVRYVFNNMKDKKELNENELKILKIKYEKKKKKGNGQTTEDQEKDFEYVEVNGQKQFRYTDKGNTKIIKINVDLKYDDAEDGNKDKPQDKEKFMDDYNSEDEKKEKKMAELLLEEDAIPNRSTDEDYESSEESSDESGDDSNDTSIGTSSDSDSDSD